MAAARVPAGFDHVKTIDPVKDDTVRLTSKSGKKVNVKIAWTFVSPDEENA